jgi:hypothetical protein
VPRYEFGFGSSYTTFVYSGLTISSLSTAAGSTAIISSVTAGLYLVVTTVGVTIKNNGTVTGAELRNYTSASHLLLPLHHLNN